MAEKKKKDAETKDKAGKKDKKEKKGKKAKGDDDAAAQGASIANHPRARATIRRTKAYVGLAGFTIAAFVSLKASVPMFQTGVRALGAGVIGYMVAWWFSVMIWRQLIIAEQKAAYEAIERRGDAGDAPAAEKPRAQQPQPAA